MRWGKVFVEKRQCLEIYVTTISGDFLKKISSKVVSDCCYTIQEVSRYKPMKCPKVKYFALKKKVK
jgi:hypothetical protein